MPVTHGIAKVPPPKVGPDQKAWLHAGSSS